MNYTFFPSIISDYSLHQSKVSFILFGLRSDIISLETNESKLEEVELSWFSWIALDQVAPLVLTVLSGGGGYTILRGLN